MNIKVEKRDGKNNGEEKQEITISIVGGIAVYGEESLQQFEDKFRELCDEYAI